MVSEVSEESRTDHPADLLKDGRLTNALVRLAVTASGAGCSSSVTTCRGTRRSASS